VAEVQIFKGPGNAILNSSGSYEAILILVDQLENHSLQPIS